MTTKAIISEYPLWLVNECVAECVTAICAREH